MKTAARANRIALAGLLALLLAPVPGWAGEPAEPPRPALGLFTTMPIYWGDAETLSDLLSPDRPLHWVRTEIEKTHDIVPLDVLVAEEGSLGELDRLVMAQPRALASAENVALDDWVRGGGRLLLFADPMLAGESRFALGDPRRAYDTVLLSPILMRWGLRLTFDDRQTGNLRFVPLNESQLPVVLAGSFEAIGTAPEAPADCELLHDALLADCAIGAGRALIVADATVLLGSLPPAAGRRPLGELMARAFASGEIAGKAWSGDQQQSENNAFLAASQP